MTQIDTVIEVVTQHSHVGKLAENRLTTLAATEAEQKAQAEELAAVAATLKDIYPPESPIPKPVHSCHVKCAHPYSSRIPTPKHHHSDQSEIDKIIARINHKNAFRVSSSELPSQQVRSTSRHDTNHQGSIQTRSQKASK